MLKPAILRNDTAVVTHGAQARLVLSATALAVILAGCTQQMGQMDWDLRGPMQGSTADAARNVTLARPMADDRGIISYPGYQVVLARPGETVSMMAARLGQNADQMARTNAINPTMPLRGGELLVLPGRVSEPAFAQQNGGWGTAPMATAPAGGAGFGGPTDVNAIATTALDRVAPASGNASAQASGIASSPRPQQAPATPFAVSRDTRGGVEPIRHKVVRGETGYVVARRYNVTPAALAEWNGLGPDLALREGQTLLIPPAGAAAPGRSTLPVAAATTAATAAPSSSRTNAPGQASATPQPPSSTKPLPQETPVRAGTGNTSAAPAAPALPNSAARSSTLAMPADGRVIRAYQKGKYDGIGIGAAAGSPVRAAADGTVAAITRDTEQVPIIVIRHSGNLLTVYANVDGIRIEKGAQVRRGQAIGTVRAGNPAFLHFEVRRGADSVDPMTLLP